MPVSKDSHKKSSHFSLKGRAAIVTGGCGILGHVFCERLAEAGAHVAVVDLNASRVASDAKRLQKKYGVKALGIVCDVSSPSSVRSMVQQVVKVFGSVEILLNNAASKSKNLNAFFKLFEDYSLKEWRNVMSVNVDGMFLVAQAVGKQMLRQKRGGSIIQTGSVYGLLAPDHRIYEGSRYKGMEISSPAVYSTSKGAVGALTQYLAAYWADKGIRVNTLVPGGVQSGQNRTFVKKYSERVPMKRMARAEELTGALIYLASDESSYVTGQTLVVDGGLSIW